MRSSGALLLLLLALSPTLGYARALPRYGTFVYSSLCWDKESGDAGGVRFALTRSRKGVRLDYEYGAGPLEGARITRIRIMGDRFEAEGSTNDGDLTVSAILEPRRARYVGPFAGRPGVPRMLKRIRSFRQKIPSCR